MNKKILKSFIITCILSLIITIFPNYTAVASSDGNDSFDLNSVDEQSTEIIKDLKESEDVFHYIETSESITFYIKEPTFIESNNILEFKEHSNFQVTNRKRGGGTGVNKVVWRSGVLNFDLYLSANAKTNISRMSTGAATGYLGHYITGKLAISIVSGALSSLLPSNSYSRGSVYVFRNGSYRYNYLQ